MAPADEIARLEYVIKRQMDKISELREENKRLLEWIMGDSGDALAILQSVYLNPGESSANRVKAASSAIGFERPRLAATAIIDTGRADLILATLYRKRALLEQGVRPGHPGWNDDMPLLIDGTLEPTDMADTLRSARLAARTKTE